MASVFFAALFCTIMMSFNFGVWEKMIDNTLRSQAGHIQIHGKGYWDDKVVDNFMYADEATLTRLEGLDNVDNVSPRVETFAMASFGTVSKGVAIIGISPRREAEKSNLPVRLVGGAYLTETDDGVLIGEGLAQYLKVATGDTLALIGQGYHGASAVGLFPVRGVLRMPTPDLDNGLAYMTLPSAQYFIDMPDGYSGILIAVKDNGRLEDTMRAVEGAVDVQTLDVYPWRFTMERLLQTAQSDQAFSWLTMWILYLIVGFGILGTVIMMTTERRREFCVIISLGMQRGRLVAVVVVELIIMSLAGAAAALAVTYPAAFWFALHPVRMSGEMAEMYMEYGMEPVLPTSTSPAIFGGQIAVILLIALLSTVYPVRKILKLKITNKQ
jgi:ABC-type lipoprotein release transport system permease subunit